ncbi:MAG: hypothetical protein JEZ03_15235 [Bacteroidales bacterium]|nr:hypothetical protein [Bacteroidales bacterium]
MALDNQHMDELFRETLGTYRAKPSAGLWSRIAQGLGGSGFGLLGAGWIKGGLYTLLSVGILGTGIYLLLNQQDQQSNYIIAVDSDDPIVKDEVLQTFDTESNENIIESGFNLVSPPENEATSNVLKLKEESNLAVEEIVESKQKSMAMDSESIAIDKVQDVVLENQTVENGDVRETIIIQNLSNETVVEINEELVELLIPDLRLESKVATLEDSKKRSPIRKRNFQYEQYSNFSLLRRAFKSGQYIVSLKYSPELIYVPGRKADFNQGVDLDFGLLYRGLSIHTGIGITRSVEVNEFSIRYTTNDSIGYYNHVTSYDYDPLSNSYNYNVQQEALYDTIEHQSTQSQDRKYYFIRVPLMFGRDLYTYKRFNFKAKLGGVFQFKLKEDASNYQLPQQAVAILEVNKNNPIPTKMNAFVVGGLQMEYLIRKKISIAIEPTFRYYIKDPYSAFYNGGKPYSLGMHAGFIIYL